MAVDPRSLIGTRFRLHGRDPAYGLDCVGLLAVIHGISNAVPDDYPLRSAPAAQWEQWLGRFAFAVSIGAEMAGDVLMLMTGPGALHRGHFTGFSLIHADAVLRRVVERPLPLPWPVIGVWRARPSVSPSVPHMT
jgi:hypothetical protein